MSVIRALMKPSRSKTVRAAAISAARVRWPRGVNTPERLLPFPVGTDDIVHSCLLSRSPQSGCGLCILDDVDVMSKAYPPPTRPIDRVVPQWLARSDPRRPSGGNREHDGGSRLLRDGR